MQKLNQSVKKCLEPSCNLSPNIELDSRGVAPRTHATYTAAQALVCNKHIEYGKEYLQQNFPGLSIKEIKNPRWLLKEQGELTTNRFEGMSRRK
jgi:hypothetical protein